MTGWYREQAARRAAVRWPPEVDPLLFDPGAQEQVQQARLQVRAVQRKFGLHEEMDRVARFLLPGVVATASEVVGRFLTLLAATGYLRNDMGSEHFRYHAVAAAPPPLAFADRDERWRAWEGLMRGALRLAGGALVGAGRPVALAPAAMYDRPTPAQWGAVAELVRRYGVAAGLDTLTYSEAHRILKDASRRR